MYQQNYNPLGNVFLSTVVPAILIVVLLYFIALHPHRDRQGGAPPRDRGPVRGLLRGRGRLYRLVPRVRDAVGLRGLGLRPRQPLGVPRHHLDRAGAMFLYTMTVITGKFEIVKESIIHISFDRRLQVLLIAFSFGAIIEGTSGFGTPVAIAGAVMVGLGFSPFQSEVLNLLANTAPVAWGAIGTPIVTLAAISGLWRPAAAHRHGGGPGRGGQDPRAPGPAPPGGLSGAGPAFGRPARSRPLPSVTLPISALDSAPPNAS